MGQVTGVVKIFVNGALLRSKPGAKLKVGGKKREMVSGHSVYGHSEEFMPSELDCTLAHMGDTDAIELSEMTDQVVRFETDSGQTYLLDGMVTTEPCELSSGGDLSLKMAGQPAVLE